MRQIKREKTEEIIHRLAAQFIQEISGNTSLITITRVELSEAGKNANIFFTTIPEKEENTAKKFLDRKIKEFKHHLRDNSKLGFIPHLDFQIDYGERNRQRLDELSKES